MRRGVCDHDRTLPGPNEQLAGKATKSVLYTADIAAPRPTVNRSSKTPMPLGWHISVYRQQNDGSAAALFGAARGTRLAVWQTGLGGLDWLDGLVQRQQAIDLGGNGYPNEYTAMAAHIVPQLRAGPPAANTVWTYDAGDVITPQWLGKTTTDPEMMDACRPDEWLLIRAWDES